ncbi:MAG TPA: ABC transporter permease subunit [Micromonosporaceae bacterium]
MLSSSLRAALFAARKRPAVWAVGGSWIVLALGFGLTVPYIVYRVLSGDPQEAESAEALLSTVLPAKLVPTGIGLFPLFGGAIVLVLGALVIGNEYRWSTLNLIFTQRPRRTHVMVGQAVALVLINLILVVVTLAAVAALMAGFAIVEDRELTWPTVSALAKVVGAAWLISSAHASLGFFLAVAFRNTATAIAVGLLWTLVIENVISGLATVLAPFDALRKVLLSPSSGALAGALGAPSQFSGGTPGVIESTSGGLPAIVLIGYTVVMFVGAAWLTTRRDVN